MSNQSKLIMIVALLLSFVVSGCDVGFAKRFRTPEAKVNPGNVAEVRAPSTVAVWVHENGKLKKAYVIVRPGWLVGPNVPKSEVK